MAWKDRYLRKSCFYLLAPSLPLLLQKTENFDSHLYQKDKKLGNLGTFCRSFSPQGHLSILFLPKDLNLFGSTGLEEFQSGFVRDSCLHIPEHTWGSVSMCRSLRSEMLGRNRPAYSVFCCVWHGQQLHLRKQLLPRPKICSIISMVSFDCEELLPCLLQGF